MSRRIRLVALALLAGFALSTAACSDLTGPNSDKEVNFEMQGSNT